MEHLALHKHAKRPVQNHPFVHKSPQRRTASKGGTQMNGQIAKGDCIIRRNQLRMKIKDNSGNALAKTINGLNKTEVIQRRCSWKTMDEVEMETFK